MGALSQCFLTNNSDDIYYFFYWYFSIQIMLLEILHFYCVYRPRYLGLLSGMLHVCFKNGLIKGEVQELTFDASVHMHAWLKWYNRF